MKFELHKSFSFEAAHWLPKVPEGHKCRRVHGHSYEVEISASGPMDEDAGWVIDLSRLSAASSAIRDRLDHRTLNEIEGLSNPTSEKLGAWILSEAKKIEPSIFKVRVSETRSSSVTVEED